ncbi:site-2 protease family protein [Devosia sp.]|uniref:site-2 protease family protein n=1 Tax=Devosia sp. TaxID=1871048 RepID=UPI0025C0585A|nr:site-2 protease family protein [Devosia sp.]
MDFIFWLLSYVVPFLVVLTIIVFVHEMGHYLVARWNGVAIQTFSLGFGPELIGFDDRHGTRWRLSAIPLGGYVRFVGDMNAASMPDESFIERAGPELSKQLFVNKSVWQRIAVVVAGPIANIIFTLLVLYALLLGYGRYTLPPVVGFVGPWSPAMAAGLHSGDRIVSVDGYDVRGFEDFQRLVATAPQRTITITLQRDGDWECTPTLVRRGAALGSNSTIVCGVTIGENALVGAGAVVTKDVPDFAIVAGVPARVIGDVRGKSFIPSSPSLRANGESQSCPA